MHQMTDTTAIRILVLLDRPVLVQTVVLTLRHDAFYVRTAHSVDEAAEMITTWRPHLAILDMDVGDGGLLRQLGIARVEARSSLPVLGLTRRGDLKTKLDAFAQGVDDIMTVPISPEELLARTLVITRRNLGVEPALRPTLRIGEMEIDILNREVRAGTSVIHLTSLEQNLLYLLAAKRGRVISRDEIIDALWGTDFISESNVVDRHVRSLRAKLHDDWRRPRFIATVPGAGYRFLLPFSADDEHQA
jgi:DNA-binding response OmpR family regulator